MSIYSAEGEPYMTAAQLRFEAELDAQSAEERFMDDLDRYCDYDDYPDPIDPEDCDHPDHDSIGDWHVECCHCESIGTRLVNSWPSQGMPDLDTTDLILWP